MAVNTTLDSKISDVNRAWTNRLDDLERSLPEIPSKALSATRATVRRMNDVTENVVRTVTGRGQHVAEQASTSARTVAGQARSAADRTAAQARRSADTAAGQARSAAKVGGDAVKSASGQARTQAEKTATTARDAAATTAGQARAQARKTAEVLENEVEGALDDAKLGVDPDELANMTKSDLYDRAQDLDIEGRSAMTKAELVTAIQQA